MPELLSPAGNFEKLKAAALYGADAVYFAGEMFGMRAAADNFTLDEIREAVAFLHSLSKKAFLTLNTIPRTNEFPVLRKYLEDLRDIEIDAFICADLGVMALLREVIPSAHIHVSTQASVVSAQTCNYYKSLGAERVVLARELNMDEVKSIRAGTDIELECFIHGSMCVSWSGRCLLSGFYCDRDSNRGKCAQPCRWNYTAKGPLYAEFHEEKRPESVLPVYEDKEGTFILSSKDMCMIEHIPELMQSGVDCFKIEGRMKSAYYTAVVTNAYRTAIDAYERDPENYKFDPAWLRELESVSHREYCTGYWFDDPMVNPQTTSNLGYIREKAYIATALSYDSDTSLACFLQRNKISVGESAELISPGLVGRCFEVAEMYDEYMNPIDSCPHPLMKFYVKMPFEIKPGDIMRGAN